MKRTILAISSIVLLMSGCQYLPLILPTPTVTHPVTTETSDTEATSTVMNTPTPILVSSETPESTATQTPFPLILQSGTPAYIQNFAHSDEGCSWLGIAGQIFDPDGKPIKNLVVNITGNLGQAEIDEIGVTGVPEADIYGPGGYEILISDKAVESANTLKIQVFDIQGNELINPVPFKTFSDCEKNLIIINFLMK